MHLSVQAISVLRAFGLRETAKRTLYYLICRALNNETFLQKPIIDCIAKHCKGMVTFIDIGADTGAIVLAVYRLFKSCIAIEPLPENFLQLQYNVSIHKAKNILLLQVALNEGEGSRYIYYDKQKTDTASFIQHNSMDKKLVKCCTLDNIVEKTKLKEPYFIKIDVQGWEYKVLKGGRETLKKNCVVVSEFWPFGLNEAGDNPLEYISFMEELGYKVYNLNGNRIRRSKLIQLCRLGINDEFVTTDFLFCRYMK